MASGSPAGLLSDARLVRCVGICCILVKFPEFAKLRRSLCTPQYRQYLLYITITIYLGLS